LHEALLNTAEVPYLLDVKWLDKHAGSMVVDRHVAIKSLIGAVQACLAEGWGLLLHRRYFGLWVRCGWSEKRAAAAGRHCCKGRVWQRHDRSDTHVVEAARRGVSIRGTCRA
jgi:hypothetical protein